jgi:hypothetical protein
MKTILRNLLMPVFLITGIAGQAQVPVMSSHPDVVPCIFLDFDGHTVQGTGWNYIPVIDCSPSTMDAAGIMAVFNRVSEDFRPFNINVTTDSLKFLAAPTTMRTRVIFTNSWEWYGYPAGGVASPNSFKDLGDDPCFVFSGLHYNNSKNVAEAASHEVGHTLGLQHQSYMNGCQVVNEYHAGFDGPNGTEISWAPIMGVGYNRNLTLWHLGNTPAGCSGPLQNDLDIIINNNLLTFRADEHGNTFPAATVVPFTANQFNVNGIITQNTDVDMIRFIQPANGRFQLNAVPYNIGDGYAGSNLDLQVTLYNGSQTLLNVYNPGNMVRSAIDTTLSAGTYYLQVEGKGNIYAPGFASIGSYSLQGISGSGGTLPLRKLQLNGLVQGDKHQLSWLIDADEQVTSQILEVSTDGRNFNPVTSAASADRSYLYRPSVSGTAIYRLNVLFDNGRQYYSNMVALRNSNVSDIPKLLTNFIDNGTLLITSPGTFDYAVYDKSGRTIRSGKLSSGLNTVATGNMAGGMYFIRYSGGNTQLSEKFIKP